MNHLKNVLVDTNVVSLVKEHCKKQCRVYFIQVAVDHRPIHALNKWEYKYNFASTFSYFLVIRTDIVIKFDKILFLKGKFFEYYLISNWNYNSLKKIHSTFIQCICIINNNFVISIYFIFNIIINKIPHSGKNLLLRIKSYFTLISKLNTNELENRNRLCNYRNNKKSKIKTIIYFIYN